MATVQDQARPIAGAKQDTFVRQQLDRVRQRVRNLDLTAALGLLPFDKISRYNGGAGTLHWFLGRL